MKVVRRRIETVTYTGTLEEKHLAELDMEQEGFVLLELGPLVDVRSGTADFSMFKLVAMKEID